MQVSKTYSGTIKEDEATVKRLVSYGAVTTSAMYPGKVDTINEIIAGFLHGQCGVDAWYGPKGDYEDSFLWIYGAPFLFGIAGNNYYASFYGPCYGTSIGAPTTATQKGLRLFGGSETAATWDYSFGLVFTGNPQNGFCLRFKVYNSNNVSGTYAMRFLKGVNLISSYEAVMFSGTVYHTATNTATGATTAPTGLNGIDLSGKYGLIDPASFSSAYMDYDPILHTKAIQRTYNGGAFPLIPIFAGPYRANGIFHRPAGYGLPPSVGLSTEVVPEVTIGGRSFLITSSDATSSSHIGLGLIETT